jgi:CBS domain-containing protein
MSKSVGLLNPLDPVTVLATDSLSDVLQVLKKNKVGGVVVVNGAEKIQGIFTERDVILKVPLSDIDLEQAKISDYMTPDPQVIAMTTTMAYALNLMSQGGFRHLPIVDDANIPLGLISVKDIVDYLVGSVTEANI